MYTENMKGALTLTTSFFGVQCVLEGGNEMTTIFT